MNIRVKGQTGEREVAKLLNNVVKQVRQGLQLPQFDARDELFQRNQMQTAVGGDDLTNPLGLSIEVKRQEIPSVPAWWRQTLESANRSNGIPILLYRQNRKRWQCMMYGGIPLQNKGSSKYNTPVGISIDDFLEWFRLYYIEYLTI